LILDLNKKGVTKQRKEKKENSALLKEAVSREDNVMSSEDFKELEKKERRNIPIISRLFRRNNNKILLENLKDTTTENFAGSTSEGINSLTRLPSKQGFNEGTRNKINEITELLIKVEKFEEREEMHKEEISAIKELISGLTERIGELRSSIISKEKDIDKIDVGLQKIEDEIHFIEPGKINKELEKKQQAIDSNSAKLEVIEDKLRLIVSDLKAYQALMRKIKSFDNLFRMLSDLDEKIKTINKDKLFTEKLASKVEMIFTEFNKRLHSIIEMEKKISYTDSLIKDLMKSIDKNSIKLENCLTKDDLTKEINKVNKEINTIKNIVFKKDIKSIAKMVQVKQTEDVTKNLIEIENKLASTNSVIEELMRRVNANEKLINKEKAEQTNEQLLYELNYLINKINNSIINKDTEGIEQLFNGAVFRYKKLLQKGHIQDMNKSYQKLMELWKKINSLS
jgi:hypothetical protein